MTQLQYLYFFVVIYISIILGIFVKWKIRDPEGATIRHSLMTPILIFIVSNKTILDHITNKDLRIHERFKAMFRTVKFTVCLFPMLVTFTIDCLSKQLEKRDQEVRSYKYLIKNLNESVMKSIVFVKS